MLALIPGTDTQAHAVKYHSNTPHIVHLKANEQYACDSNCPHAVGI